MLVYFQVVYNMALLEIHCLLCVCITIVGLTVFKRSMTVSTAGVNPGIVPNSYSNIRSRSSWSPVVRTQPTIKCTAGLNSIKFTVTIRTLEHTKSAVVWVSVQFLQNMWNRWHGFTKVFHLSLSKRTCTKFMNIRESFHKLLSQQSEKCYIPLSTTTSRDPRIIGFLAPLLPLLAFDDTV